MGVFSFRSGPTYRAATPDEQMAAAIDMPLSFGATLRQQAKGGALDSYGLGTAIKDFTIPEGETTATDQAKSVLKMLNPVTSGYESTRRAAQYLLGDDSPAMTEDAYNGSAYYRDGIAWDQGMTEDRAAALAEHYDAKRVREHFASKRPVTSFFGGLGGQALDPINYIPIAGPALRAANAARFGKVAGAAATSSIDAAANTALFGIGTAPTRARYGDDVSWQALTTDIAMSALIGGAFGSVAGVLGKRRDVRMAEAEKAANIRLSTLKNVQDARIALNDAIDGLARGEDVALSANAVEAVQRISARPEVAGLDLTTPLLERSDFVEWFGGSQITDDAGAPLVVYHGTGANFDQFQIDSTGSAMDAGKLGRGFYFSTRPDVASGYANAAEARGGSPSVMPVYLAIKNPVVFDAAEPGNIWTKLRAVSSDWGIELDPVARGAETGLPNDAWAYAFSEVAQEKGFDGVVLKFKDGSKEIVAFNPTQIKSSLNRGAFSAADPRIIDTAIAKADAPPTGKAEAEARVAQPDSYKAMAEQYRVNPEDGSFLEQSDIDQMRNAGRLTADDELAISEAESSYETGVSYGEALKSVVGCLIQ